MIYVTHDQVEAMTLADRIVVLDHAGEIAQTGATARTLRISRLRYLCRAASSAIASDEFPTRHDRKGGGTVMQPGVEIGLQGGRPRSFP